MTPRDVRLIRGLIADEPDACDDPQVLGHGLDEVGLCRGNPGGVCLPDTPD